MQIQQSNATVTVWMSDGGELHDGIAIENIIELEDGKPVGYQCTLYLNGDVELSVDPPVEQVPQMVRDRVEQHMIPRGAWPN